MKDRTTKLIRDFYNKYPNLFEISKDITDAINSLVETVKKGKKILLCGNGGSAADAQHFAGELMKAFMLERPLDTDTQTKLIELYGNDGKYMAENLEEGIKCIPLIGFDSLFTAYANDKTADLVFAQQVNALGDEGDVLFCITTSGNSSNVVYAAKLAKIRGLQIISLTGQTGGIIKDISNITIKAPSSVVYEIQELHLPIYHLLCLAIESELYEY